MNNNLIKYHPYSSQAQSQSSLARVKNIQANDNQKTKNQSNLNKPVFASNKTSQKNKENVKFNNKNLATNAINSNYEYEAYKTLNSNLFF